MSIYIVNFKNPERKSRMTRRFQALNLEVNFIPEVLTSDPRIPQELENNQKRIWAVTWQHLDAIRHFIEKTNSNYIIICEDDIYISRDFARVIPRLEQSMKIHNLDCLLLGYLIPFKIQDNEHFKKIGELEYMSIFKYPDDLWGAQSYMFTRKHAEFVMSYLTNEYKLKEFSPDWTLTKIGNRALLHPMLAVEEGINISDCKFQQEYHKTCYEVNYDSELYI